MLRILGRTKTEVIFHAAAYKHVPVMEAYPVAAADNNVLGTSSVVRAAAQLGIEHFVLISTDKAVNPSSVMGASKRAAELVVCAVAESAMPRRNYISVRFGNVLGSTGSVVPIFESQISRGGPVTVTHPEMKRYFMTVREACQLVLQAFALAEEREVFVLDIGKPVRIVDLARTMIQFAGLMPDRDIEIRYTGLRPGEKMHEELNTQGEAYMATSNPKIKILRHAHHSNGETLRWLGELEGLVTARDCAGILSHLQRLIPEYCIVEVPGMTGLRGWSDSSLVASGAPEVLEVAESPWAHARS